MIRLLFGIKKIYFKEDQQNVKDGLNCLNVTRNIRKVHVATFHKHLIDLLAVDKTPWEALWKKKEDADKSLALESP